MDIAAIKNTNTKIVLRTPEANDRDAVGRSIGLTADQVNEIAKLPGGVAVVYQNDWVAPVLTMIDRADVREQPYMAERKTKIRTLVSARLLLLRMLMQPWIGQGTINEQELKAALKVVDISRESKKRIDTMIDDYTLCNGLLIWKKQDMSKLQSLVQDILDLEARDFMKLESPEDLKKLVESRLAKCSNDDINNICYVLTL